jgi:O-antigen/teichoic acid export membrane protein
LNEEVTTGALALALRGAALALRFALPLALIRLLGLEAAGLFALVAATAAIAPAALGWGLNNLLTRNLVLHPDQAPRLIATRLAVTSASIAAAILAALAVFCVTVPMPGLPIAPTLTIIALETLALDIHVILIARGRAKRANLLLFLRSAGWIPLFLIGAWSLPDLRTLDAALSAWIAGHFAALAALTPLALAAPWRTAIIDPAWLKRSARDCLWIYVADLGLVGQLYGDRYLVGALIGLEATAIYGVCAAVGQALQVLASSAVIQPALPRLIASAHREPVTAAHLKPLAARLAVIALPLLAMLATGAILLAETGVLKISAATAWTLCLLCCAATARSLSDGVNALLVGQGRHRAYARLSLLGAALSLGLSVLLLPLLGLPGAGLAAFGAALAALIGRIKAAEKHNLP